MRRADRLFQLVLQLGRGRVRTARALGEVLGVSERTVYRDIVDLVASGTPIQGAPGIGYSLRAGYQLPPLMFEREELEALALGAAWVSGYGDPALRAAAERVLAKVDSVLPARLRPELRAEGMEVLDFSFSDAARACLASARGAIRDRRVLDARYIDESGRETRRRLRPLGLFYWGKVWTLAAWCELRRDYRSFRIDRFPALQALAEPIPDDPAISLRDFMARACEA
jgi:predicted DNA-binding transcriptional regulator YafY